MGNITEKEIQELEKIAQWLDNKFRIPGTSIRFGIDSLLGLIPGIGDTSTLLVTVLLTERARRYGVPSHIRGKMYGNAAIDWLIGLVPFLGDLFDVGWKANLRNVALLRKHMQDNP